MDFIRKLVSKSNSEQKEKNQNQIQFIPQQSSDSLPQYEEIVHNPMNATIIEKPKNKKADEIKSMINSVYDNALNDFFTELKFIIDAIGNCERQNIWVDQNFKYSISNNNIYFVILCEYNHKLYKFAKLLLKDRFDIKTKSSHQICDIILIEEANISCIAVKIKIGQFDMSKETDVYTIDLYNHLTYNNTDQNYKYYDQTTKLLDNIKLYNETIYAQLKNSIYESIENNAKIGQFYMNEIEISSNCNTIFFGKLKKELELDGFVVKYTLYNPKNYLNKYNYYSTHIRISISC